MTMRKFCVLCLLAIGLTAFGSYADNYQLRDALGDDHTIAADEIEGITIPRFKPVIGTDGEAADVSNIAPMPVTLMPKSVDTVVTTYDLNLNYTGAIYSVTGADNTAPITVTTDHTFSEDDLSTYVTSTSQTSEVMLVLMDSGNSLVKPLVIRLNYSPA